MPHFLPKLDYHKAPITELPKHPSSCTFAPNRPNFKTTSDFWVCSKGWVEQRGVNQSSLKVSREACLSENPFECVPDGAYYWKERRSAFYFVCVCVCETVSSKDVNDNPICRTEKKKTQIYRTVF